MKRNILAGLAACLSIISLGAHAVATASADLNHQGFVVGDPVTPQVSTWWQESKTLASGETWTVIVPYTIELSSTGQALGMRPFTGQCTDAFPMACQSAFNGYESAEAYLYWVVDGRYGQLDSIDLSFSGDQDFYINNGRQAYSGMMTFAATNNDIGSRVVSADLMVGLFSDTASVVPEPASAGLFLAGLSLLAARRRRD